MRQVDAEGAAPAAAAVTMETPVGDATAPAVAAPAPNPPMIPAVQPVGSGADGIVALPADVDLSDIRVVGRDLVIALPDGSEMVIVDGAVFVPQLVIGDIEVPAANLAALLIEAEPKPAAGRPFSSGGNFAVEVPPLDPGVPLGDLIPPTQLAYTPPEFREVNAFEDDEPGVVVEPDGQPAAVNANDQVNEAGLPVRNAGEPAGSGESADGNGTDNDDPSEATSGTILYDANDGLQSVTINNVEVTTVGQSIAGQYGAITITSIADGAIGYTYTLADNTSGDTTSDLFTVVVTDDDGDTATATSTIAIVDDVPTARDDSDAVGEDRHTADGNVLTGAGTISGAAGADTVGADNAQVSGVHPGTTGGFTAVTAAGVTIDGQYGTLTLFADGGYDYTRNAGGPDGVSDVFTYQLTDGDGDVSTATLTIAIPDFNLPPVVGSSSVSVSEEGLPAGLPDGEGNPDTTDEASANGTVAINDPDGDATTVALGAPAGSYTSGGVPIVWTVSDGGHTLTGAAAGVPVVTVTINDTGAYDVLLSGPFDQPDGTIEDAISFTVPVTVSDGTVTIPSTIVVTVEDDSPTASTSQLTATVDEDGLAGGIPDGPDDVPGVATVASGSVAALFNSGADTPLTYNLLTSTSGLPSLTSGGIPVIYAVDGDTLTASAGGSPLFTFVLDAEGNYTFTLLGQLDHPTLNGASGDDSENDLSIALGSLIQATDADGDSVSAAGRGLVITIDDDTPVAQDDTASLIIPIDNLGVDLISAEWTDTILSSGAPLAFDRDGDGLTDEIRWGTGNQGRSGYGFVDNPALADDTVLTNQTFSLGTFTHYNNPIDPPELQSTTLTVNFVAHINGQDIPVGPIEISFVHDETDNTNNPEVSRDIIMITAQTTTIVIEGVEYELQVQGLVDENGDVVTTVRTFEGQTNSYELLVRFVQTDAVELEGDVLANDSPGADDPIEVVSASGFGGSADDSADADGNYQVNGQYGVLTLNADGSYTYRLTADVLSVPDDAVEHFVYTIEDFDGDRTTAKLDITLNPQTAPVANDVMMIADDSPAGLIGAPDAGIANVRADERTAVSGLNHNNVLMTAIAATGLATVRDGMAHEYRAPRDDVPSDAYPADQAAASLSENSGTGRIAPRDPLPVEAREADLWQSQGGLPHNRSSGPDDHALTDPPVEPSLPPAELLEGTQSGWSAIANSTFTSTAVGVPSAAMLAVPNSGDDGQAKTDGEVGRVLADALAAGGNDPTMEAVLDAAAPQGWAAHQGEALASHVDAPVPAWDTADSGGSPEFARVMMVMEHGLHPDAVPPAA